MAESEPLGLAAFSPARPFVLAAAISARRHGAGTDPQDPDEYEALAAVRCKECGRLMWAAVGTTER